MELSVVECSDLPENPDTNKVYKLRPKNPNENYYWERVDRNLGWLTKKEQSILRNSVIGVAGCGGMGGQLAEKFLRLGVGEIRIADCEVFDASNINRQFAAGRDTIGKSKAFETAKIIRSISDDSALVVYPQGISEKTADHFLAGCDVVCDEIEFWAVGARILLHERGRRQNLPIFNCNTVGFGTRLFLFTPTSMTVEELLGLEYWEAKKLQEKVQRRQASKEEVNKIMEAVLIGLVPELPAYRVDEQDRIELRRRLFEEGRASIVATNPPMATGFLADRVLFHLLHASGVRRDIVPTPEMPGYLYFDAAKMEAKAVREKWS